MPPRRASSRLASLRCGGPEAAAAGGTAARDVPLARTAQAEAALPHGRD
jgi:hypothetical protein